MSRLATSYFDARKRFRSGAGALGWSQFAYPITARGPTGEQLTIDVAISPGVAQAPALIISSGVHGVEGFFGSAVQSNFLNELRSGVPQGLRIVLIHAISPYGFAHRRRLDETNTDPNRNFLLPGDEYRGSPPLYGILDPILNPKQAPTSIWPDGFLLHSAWFICKHGYSALKQAIAGGQYDYPQGIFYGGARPSESSQILLNYFPEWLHEARDVLHLDFHTGLGTWGDYILIVDPPLKPDQHHQVCDWFGRNYVKLASPTGVDYYTRGGFGDWCVHHHSHRNYIYLCAEFGTYRHLTMLNAIRRENMAHHYAEPGSEIWERCKSALKEAFAPASPRWQEAVLTKSQVLIQRAINGMTQRGN